MTSKNLTSVIVQECNGSKESQHYYKETRIVSNMIATKVCHLMCRFDSLCPKNIPITFYHSVNRKRLITTNISKRWGGL